MHYHQKEYGHYYTGYYKNNFYFFDNTGAFNNETGDVYITPGITVSGASNLSTQSDIHGKEQGFYLEVICFSVQMPTLFPLHWTLSIFPLDKPPTLVYSKDILITKQRNQIWV